MLWFAIGIAVGVALAIPLAAWAARRASLRTRELAQRARNAERLAELGTMTGGLAHEIKNPLSTVGLNIQLLQEDLAELVPNSGNASDAAVPMSPAELTERIGRVQRRLGTLARETSRLRQILDDFLRFAGRMELHLEPVDVNRLIDELCDFFLPQAQESQVQLRTQLDATPATVQGDASLLKQAILNLMINAVQAMSGARASGTPSGGNSELIIRTERARGVGRDELRIHVIDTGPGIPADRVEQVFMPYFSTKRGGTGLGLPTTRRIVEEHSGSITLHTEEGRGTDFTIRLPASS